MTQNELQAAVVKAVQVALKMAVEPLTEAEKEAAAQALLVLMSDTPGMGLESDTAQLPASDLARLLQKEAVYDTLRDRMASDLRGEAAATRVKMQQHSPGSKKHLFLEGTATALDSAAGYAVRMFKNLGV
jgi:hypothetical protein